MREKLFDSSMEQPLEQEGAVVQQGEAAVQAGCARVYSISCGICLAAWSGTAASQWICAAD